MADPLYQKRQEQRRKSLIATDSWTVKLHPDSGINFFANAESHELSWSDPFTEEHETTTDDAVNQVEDMENNLDEHEKVRAGGTPQEERSDDCSSRASLRLASLVLLLTPLFACFLTHPCSLPGFPSPLPPITWQARSVTTPLIEFRTS